MKSEEFISIPKLAKLMGVSRTAVYKRVKKGEIKAIRIGRIYAIPKETVKELFGGAKVKGKALTEERKKIIDRAVAKTIKEYGEVLRLLGDE